MGFEGNDEGELDDQKAENIKDEKDDDIRENEDDTIWDKIDWSEDNSKEQSDSIWNEIDWSEDNSKEQNDSIWNEIDWTNDNSGEKEDSIWKEINWNEDESGEKEIDERENLDDESDAEKNNSNEQQEERNEEDLHENLSSQSTSTVLVSENIEEIQEVDHNQDELEREIEKELEEGVEAINQNLEEEAEFINAYQEMMGKAKEIEEELKQQGEEPLKTEEEWEREIETAAYFAEQLYESAKEIENASTGVDELEIEKEAEQSAEISEPQLSINKEEISELEELADMIEQHQVDPFIEEALETKPEPIVNNEVLEEIQEMELEEQFQTVNFNEYIEELVENQNEAEQLKEHDVEAQVDNVKENGYELEEELEERNLVEQHQITSFIEEALENEQETATNDKEIEQLQELTLEEQHETVHFNDFVNELVEEQEEEKNQEYDKKEQEHIEQTQEVIQQSTYPQEQLEEQEQNIEQEYEEKDLVEQHQVEAAIEEELETEPKPIIQEEELEYIKNFEPEKQLEAELLYELIEELAQKQKEGKKEIEEKEEQNDISTKQKVAQIKRKLQIPQENSAETEVEVDNKEVDITLVEPKQEEEEQEDIDKNSEKNYEIAKSRYKQQTGKRPIYANKETKGFKQWLEQSKESKEEEKTKQIQEPKEERKKEESWKSTLKNWIEQATEIEQELKSELTKLVEKYNELEKLIKKYKQLYNKAKSEELSQNEMAEFAALNKMLLKIDPIKIEMFLDLRDIKRYLIEMYFYDFWDKPRVNQIRTLFFTHISQQYKSLKQAQKKKEKSEEILTDWIAQSSDVEISPELKVKLKEIVENYNKLDEMAIKFMKLYTKAQHEKLSKIDQNKLDMLVRTLQKLDPSKIELFTKIKAIKHYLNNKNSEDSSEKTRINRLLSQFFVQFEQTSYNSKNVIKNSKFLENLIGEGFKKKHLAQLFKISERNFYNLVIEKLKMNFNDAKDEYFYKPKIISLYVNGYKASQMASVLSDVKESEIKSGFSKNTIYNSIKRIWNEIFRDFNDDFTALDNYLSNKYRKAEKKEKLTFDEKFKTNLTIHIKCLMNSAGFKTLGIHMKLVDSEKVINFFKKYKLYASLRLKNPIYASAVSLFMHLMFHQDLDTLILNKTKYSKILSINDDTFSKYYIGYCKRISLNINEYKKKLFQNFDDLLCKLSINYNIGLSEEFKTELKNGAKELYEYFNKFEISKIKINDIIHKGDFELYHPKYVGAMLIHFFKDKCEFTYKGSSGNQVTYASLDNLRDLLGIGSTQRLRLLYENRVVIAEKYLKRRLKHRKISDKEISSFLKKNKEKEEVKLVNLLLKCSNLNLRKLLKITGMFEGKVNIALENLSETSYYFKLETLENKILPFIQSIRKFEKPMVALTGYKDYLDYYNEKIRKTSEKARKREKEEKEKYGNNFKSFEVRILRFLQTLGFSFDDYDLVSHLREMNYNSSENTAIFHHSDAVKENDEILNLLYLPKKRKVDRGKDVSYTYHSHAFVHTKEGINTIKKFLRFLCNSTENNDSEILNDLQFLNWNQDSIELAKSRLIDFDWVHNIYEYLPKYGDWKKINFKKLNILVEKYLHPNFKKSLKIIEQDFKNSWERYLERMKEYRKKKYENF